MFFAGRHQEIRYKRTKFSRYKRFEGTFFFHLQVSVSNPEYEYHSTTFAYSRALWNLEVY